MSIETKARNKRFVQLAVTTALATTALTACTGKAAPGHASSAAHAEKALDKGQASKAVRHAEAAVLASPRDAATRTLLANAYLEDGRFASAATTFAEAVELGDTAPRTVISFTLAQIAVGDQRGALATLDRFEAALDPADYGLAIALSGRPDRGVHVLGNALRAGQNTPKVRQNLAYAYAMSGQWREARLMVAEDVPADMVGERMAEWGAIAHPEQFRTRIASLLGVDIVADPGQLRIGEVGVDRAVANRVDRHGAPPLLRLGHRMMPLQPGRDGPPAQPAGERPALFVSRRRNRYPGSLRHTLRPPSHRPTPRPPCTAGRPDSRRRARPTPRR